ncbi:MAG: potassium channel family protein [Hyphomonadaceae bacterium]|nr:potassium channel family protein [Hyphomonadaceae bacterium]
MLFASLFLAGVLVLVTCAVQFSGLVGLSWVMRRRYMRHPEQLTGRASQGATIVMVVLGLFMLHTIQIWLYALTYLALGQFDAVEPALYFSTSTFTTVGFGDLILTEDWRMLAAAESANGFLLIGWSTAFLVAVSARVRMFEAEIEQSDSQ